MGIELGVAHINAILEIIIMLKIVFTLGIKLLKHKMQGHGLFTGTLKH